MVLVILQLAVTSMLAGLCWTIQLVVYPQFANVPRVGFQHYHAQHMRGITWVVAPLMLTELMLGLWLVSRPSIEPMLAWLLLVMTALVWLSTALIQVPLHSQLERAGANPRLFQRLVRSNWIRTIAWTARTIVLAGALFHWVARVAP